MRTTETIPLRANFIGTARSLTVFRSGAPDARPKAYLQAALHASEMTGVLALHHLLPLLDAAQAAGRVAGQVVVVPLANPIGLGEYLGGDQMGRFEQLSHGNYNRDHPEISREVAARVAGRLGPDPAANTATIRAAALAHLASIEPRNELQALKVTLQRLAIDADIVVDLHSDNVAAMFMYIDGLHWPALADLAARLRCAATVRYDPYVPTATFCGAIGGLWPRLQDHFGPALPIPAACQTAMVEVRGRHACRDELAQADAQGLLAFLHDRGIVTGPPPPPAEPPVEPTPIEGMDVGYAPAAGLTVFHKPPGARVQDGDLVCEVIDPTRAPPADRMKIHARGTGVLYARADDGMLVPPGKVLFRIACPQPLPHRRGRSWLDD